MFKRYARRAINKRRIFRRKSYSKKFLSRRKLGANTRKVEKSNALATNIGGPSRHTLFPPNKVVMLKYADKQVLTSTDTDAIWTYVLNGPYDPDLTGTGSQPRYYDTLLGANSSSAPYYNYRVIGARYKVTMINVNSSGNSVGVVGTHVRKSTNSAISPIAVYQVAEVPNTKWTFIGSSGSDSCHHIFTGYVSIGKILGNKNIRDNENAAAAYNANPSDAVYLDCMYRTVNAASTAYTLQVATEIEYMIELFSQNLPVQS